jgi:hypothetical protein
VSKQTPEIAFLSLRQARRKKVGIPLLAAYSFAYDVAGGQMRKVIYGFGVAVLTFTLGSVTYYLTASKPSSQPIPVVEIKPSDLRYDNSFSVSEIKGPMEVPAAAPAPVDFSVVFQYGVEHQILGTIPVKLSKKLAVLADLDIGDNIYGKEITIVGGDQSAQYRIFERYRNSMRVMGEGPHLDLIDWRHFDSEWIELDQLAQRKFRTLAYEQMDSSKFPPVTNAELVSAVRKRASDWPQIVELAKTCHNPNDEPCSVSDSSLYFRIEKLVGDRWTTVGMVEVYIPMGC